MSSLPIRRSGDMLDVADDMDLMLDTWPKWPSTYTVQDGFWHPTTDIYDEEREIVVELELPQVMEKDIDISVEEDHLIVKGKRDRPAEYKEDERYYSERSFGKFHKIVHLPESVDVENVKARFRDGMLTITMMKKQAERGRKIHLEAA